MEDNESGNTPTARRFRIDGRSYVLISGDGRRATSHPRLSDAEHEVATLATHGLSNDDIAARRDTSRRTVANQLASVYRKLGVNSREQLAARVSCSGAV